MQLRGIRLWGLVFPCLAVTVNKTTATWLLVVANMLQHSGHVYPSEHICMQGHAGQITKDRLNAIWHGACAARTIEQGIQSNRQTRHAM